MCIIYKKKKDKGRENIRGLQHLWIAIFYLREAAKSFFFNGCANKALPPPPPSLMAVGKDGFKMRRRRENKG